MKLIAQARQKISEFYSRYRLAFWAFFAFAFALIVRVLFHKKEERTELNNELTNIVIKKKTEILQTAVSQNEQAVAKAEEEVKEVDTAINQIQEEKEKVTARIDGMNLRELNNDFKSLY